MPTKAVPNPKAVQLEFNDVQTIDMISVNTHPEVQDHTQDRLAQGLADYK